MCIAALKTLEKNGKIKINDNQIKHGLKKIDWPGRLSILSGKLNNIINKNCDIWLDGCHNPAASEVIADEIKNMDKERKKETILILGMSKDKNIGKFIDNFFDVSKEIIIIPLENKPSINLEEAVNAVNNLDYNISKQLSIIDALESLSDRDNLRVLICGSLYLVAETLSLN
jgi:dihydrofolate synthase/folylpolyglutamate synthase